MRGDARDLPGRLARAPLALAVALGLLAFACGPRVEPRAGERAGFACPHDAIAVAGVCRCAAGLTVLEGACVGPRELDAYCGTPAVGGACTTSLCANGDPIDLATRTCLPASAARAVLSRVRPVPGDLALGCREGRALVVHGDYVGCLPMADVCPRATAWDARAARCVPPPACAPGQVRGEKDDEDAGKCVPIVTRASGVPVVDVGAWSRAILGGDGGEGTSHLCRPLSQQPWELNVDPGGARTLTLSFEILFPNNDVTEVSGRVETIDAASHQPLAGPGALAAQSALDTLLVPLRALGGTSDAASTTVRVRCVVHGGASPLLAPRR